MDETDIILIKLLLANSRTPYRQLADQLDLSVNAVHIRIQTLKKLGIIHTFTAKISQSAIKAVNIYVFGSSEADSLSHIHNTLGSHDFTYWVSVAGGNYLYLGALLQSISDLGSYMAFVQKEAQFPDPTVGILHSASSSHNTTVGISHSAGSSHLLPPRDTDTKFYPLDYQIIYSLRNNSRKAFADIAEELGVSAKTIRRRLSRMIDENLIELSLEWYPDKSNDIMTIFHIHLGDSVDNSKVLSLLFDKYSSNVIFPTYFSNLPNHVVCVVWTNTMKKLKEIWEQFEREETFESIVANILYTGEIF
ncbi:MAG: winged helix-turn-helix transcriptional regulator, partial [Candidatus Heimdallarchaeota archaeon]